MSDEQALHRAISTIAQSDPLIKLLQEVRLGRMKPADPGLRAVTESWLGTYRKVLESPGLTRGALLRLDPSPRMEVLIAAGVLPADHAAIASLRAVFEQMLLSAPSS
jgi:hypothetical protein